jgi:transcription elongation factor GreB
LMKSAAGDSVVLQVPGGTEYLTVLEVCYERISVEPFREPAGAEASAKGLLAVAKPPDEETARLAYPQRSAEPHF